MSGNLNCVVVAVDDSEESMSALKWAINNVKLRSSIHDSPDGKFIVLHVQSAPSISAGVSPAAIPFGGPSDLDVPAFAAAIQAHQKRITLAILRHALQICSSHDIGVRTQVVIGNPKEKICEVVKSLRADLLVMGTRPSGSIKRMFSGRECQQILRNPRNLPSHYSQGQKELINMKDWGTLGSAMATKIPL